MTRKLATKIVKAILDAGPLATYSGQGFLNPLKRTPESAAKIQKEKFDPFPRDKQFGLRADNFGQVGDHDF